MPTEILDLHVKRLKCLTWPESVNAYYIRNYDPYMFRFVLKKNVRLHVKTDNIYTKDHQLSFLFINHLCVCNRNWGQLPSQSGPMSFWLLTRIHWIIPMWAMQLILIPRVRSLDHGNSLSPKGCDQTEHLSWAGKSW